MVTGATNGIGKVTARELAGKGAEVVIVSRTLTKLENTVSKIKSETGNQNVSYIQADLSSMDEVRQVAETFKASHNRLDVLVNNAGAYFNERRESADGYEMTLALNHLNYFLLTNLLLDVLKDTADAHGQARIVNVSSEAHRNTTVNFDDLQRHNKYSGFTVYGESKLMNILFTYEMDRRLQGTGVTVNALHPGFVNTGFAMNNDGIVKWLMSGIQALFAKSEEEGAQTSIYLAASPEVKGISGKYFADKQQKKSSDASYNLDAQKRLWQISEQLIGLTEPAAESA
jgi:NAD(P)-dependent dehydrogenase (short-subunit alcohol dehydrogenase family)